MSEWRDISGNNSIWCMGDPQNPEAYIFREKSGNWQWHAAGKTGMKTKRHLAMNAAAKAYEEAEVKKKCEYANQSIPRTR